MMGSDRQETSLTEPIKSRYSKIREHKIPEAAITRFLNQRDIDEPDSDENFYLEVAKRLDDGLLDELIQEYKYAGQQTLNYFVMTGLQKYDFDQITSSARSTFPEREEVEGITNSPYFADSEVLNDRLYLTFGFFTGTGGVDPITGSKKGELTTNRCVAVLTPDSDLVELRTSEPSIADAVISKIASGLGNFYESNIYQPEFNSEFQEAFNDLVEKYTNLKVRVEDREGTTVDTISFTSREASSGEREDARKDERVARELNERGGEITIGYVHLTDGFRFQINRKQAKISIRKYESEENINEITKIIDDVLDQTGGYPQSTLGGIEDVPE